MKRHPAARSHRRGLQYVGCFLVLAITAVLAAVAIGWAYQRSPDITQRLFLILLVGLAGGLVWVLLVLVLEYWKPWRRFHRRSR